MSFTSLAELALVNPPRQLPPGISLQSEVSFIPMGDVDENGHWFKQQTKKLIDVASGFTPFINNDVLVAKITPCMENGKGAIVTNMKNGVGFGSTEFHVLRAMPGVSSRFIFHITQSKQFRTSAEAFMIGSAGQQRVQKDFFEHYIVPVLSFTEQNLIADILDDHDTSIRQTEAIIAKLQQVKKGLLHDLLTRGIDDSGQLRPPQHLAPELYKETSQGYFPIDWEEIPLGQMAEIVSGVTVGGNGKGSLVSDIPYLRVANVQDGYLDLSEIKTIKVSQQERDRYLLQYGDVLMNEGGDFDKLGRGTVWENQIPICIHQNHVFRVRTDANKLRPFYLAYWSASAFGKRYFILSSKQSTNLASINSTQLHAYPIMVPPEHEQIAIEDRVASINQKIEIETVKKEKLKKQKSGLMNDLLTGKARVTSLL